MPTVTGSDPFDPNADTIRTIRVFPRDRQLIDVRTPEEYVLLVEAEAYRNAPAPAPATAPDLVRALDHLAMAVTLSPTLRWKHLLERHWLTPVVRLTQPVTSAEEFSDRISALANILGDLNVPDIPDGDWTGEGSPKPLSRMQYWLGTQHELDVQRNIAILRAIVRVRVHHQHPNADKGLQWTYATAGLHMPITDWPGSWAAILGRATHAILGLADAVLYGESSDDI
jgi:hypothetical protein